MPGVPHRRAAVDRGAPAGPCPGAKVLQWAPLLDAVIQKRERKRRDGKAYSVYRVRWYEAGGRERSRSFDTLADAKAFEGKVRTLKRTDGLAQLDAGTETLAAFAAEWWELYAKPNLERATLTNYASVFNKHLLPRIGHVRLRDLSVPRLMRLRADLEADGVGREAVRKSLAVLQSILQRAVEWKRIGSNPVRAVRKPPMRRDRAITPLAPATIEGIRTALLGQGRMRDATLVSVLAYAGVRPQEAVALRWRHVRQHTMLIERAVADGAFKGQKTSRPPPTVRLLAPLRADLAVWRAQQRPTRDEDLLFPNASGEPWQSTTGTTGADGSSGRRRAPPAPRIRAPMTCVTRLPACSSTKGVTRSWRSPRSSGTIRQPACRRTPT